MSTNRIDSMISVLRGFLIAVVTTLIGMFAIAALTVFVRISDGTVSVLNQLIKILAIVLGTWTAVGRGGSHGFVTGVVLALIYMIAGYSLYVALSGGAWSASDMLGEMLLGAAVGGVCGAILANLSPRSRRRKAVR